MNEQLLIWQSGECLKSVKETLDICGLQVFKVNNSLRKAFISVDYKLGSISHVDILTIEHNRTHWIVR